MENYKDRHFDGQLTAKEIYNLKLHGFSEKEIQVIKDYVYKYREQLTGFVDLIGDKEAPSHQFLKNIQKFGYLLDDNPEAVISKKDVLLRKLIIDKLVRLIGPSQLKNRQVFENRNELTKDPNDKSKPKKDSKIILPKEPVIWTPNHHFKDDVLASYLATKRQSYILFGSLPQFFNTVDGVLANLVGSLLTNRKVSQSKQASIIKAGRAIDFGSDILCFPEGIWDKYPNELLLEFWKGVYIIANEKGTKVAPIVNYIFDPTLQIDSKLNPIHTVVDDPIDITKFSEKAGLSYLRDVMATWYYLMMEKYGQTTRESIIEFYEKRAIERNPELRKEDFENNHLTSHEAFELYLMDLLDTVDWYDSEIELSYDYRPESIVRPETAFEPIADIKNSNPQNVADVVYARQLVNTRKKEDYQRRF